MELFIEELENVGFEFLNQNVFVGVSSMVHISMVGNVCDIITIATSSEFRNTGSASKVLTAMCQVAEHTNTTLTLTTGIVKQTSFMNKMSPELICGSMAANNKGKIPMKKLNEFYAKFGFIETERVKNNISMKFN